MGWNKKTSFKHGSIKLRHEKAEIENDAKEEPEEGLPSRSHPVGTQDSTRNCCQIVGFLFFVLILWSKGTTSHIFQGLFSFWLWDLFQKPAVKKLIVPLHQEMMRTRVQQMMRRKVPQMQSGSWEITATSCSVSWWLPTETSRSLVPNLFWGLAGLNGGKGVII